MSPVRMRALACFLGVAIFGCNNPTKNNVTQNLQTVGPDPVTSVLPVGEWGGSDIQLDIQNNGGGIFTFDCGGASTNLPIVPDDNGHFDMPGSYTAFANPNDPSQTTFPTQDVIFHGDVSGDSINIDVEFPNGDGPNGAPMSGLNVMHGTASMINDCQ